MTKMAGIFSIAVLATSSGAAAQVLPSLPLPITASADIGVGSNPVLGDARLSFPAVHFLDTGTSPHTLRLWDRTLGTSGVSPIYNNFPAEAVFSDMRCSWHDRFLFCGGHLYWDVAYWNGYGVRAYDFETGTLGQHLLPGNITSGTSIASASEHAVVELDGGELRLVDWTNPPSMTSSLVATGTGGFHAKVDEIAPELVVYQQETGGIWSLNVWRHGLPANATEASHLVSDSPNPSQMRGAWVSHDLEVAGTPLPYDSVQSTYVLGGWDPGAPAFIPADHGCDSFHGLKSDHPAIQLVEGINCAGIPSVLFAMTWNGLTNTYQAYTVGNLLPSNPEYDGFGDEIVYVDDTGTIKWVKAYVHGLGPYVDEVEPNYTPANAVHLPPEKIGVGFFTGVPEPGADLDYWTVDLTVGEVYDFKTGVREPGDFCGDWVTSRHLHLYDTDGTTVLADNHTNVQDFQGVPSLSYCGIIENFVAPATGRYYLRVRNYWGDTYQLGVVEH